MTQLNLELNIGLVASERFPEHTQKRVLREVNTSTRMQIPYIVFGVLADLHDNGFTVVEHAVVESTTEPTLWVRVNTTSELWCNRLTQVGSRYAQDCIAVRHRSGHGQLVGKYNHIWGTFDPKYFMTPKPVKQYPCVTRHHSAGLSIQLDAEYRVSLDRLAHFKSTANSLDDNVLKIHKPADFEYDHDLTVALFGVRP